MHILAISQFTVAVILIVLILLQERSSGLSGMFGSDNQSGGFYQTRRGLEKLIFGLTIICAIAFIGLALAYLAI